MEPDQPSEDCAMKAMLLPASASIEQSPLVLSELPAPNPGLGQIRIRVRVCGVCHTDLHTVEGELSLPKLPVVPGHQIVGVVDALGEGVTRFQVGDRVGVPWLHKSCGACEYCRRGDENLCESAHFTGLHVDGGYAEYTLAPADFAYPIPNVFSDVEASPLLCAGIIGYRSLRLSEIQSGQRLGLYGFGASAHIAIQIARHWDCDVYVFTRTESHRQLARELGAAWVGDARDDPGVRLHSSITFAPAGWIVPQALRVLDKGGTLAINAIHMSPIPEMPYDLIYHERTLRSVANSTRQDAEDLLKVAAEIPIQTEVQTFPLEEANRALQALKASQIDGAAALHISED
jgi:propanol-preferring alcohol dehydrogenase